MRWELLIVCEGMNAVELFENHFAISVVGIHWERMKKG
jgi:hypothetical protein